MAQTYISTGFSNVKNVAANFSKQEVANIIKTVLKSVTLPSKPSDIGEILSSQLARERLQGQKCLLKQQSLIISAVLLIIMHMLIISVINHIAYSLVIAVIILDAYVILILA